MSVLPFSDFLDLLRAKGLGVGLHEHLAVGKLLERWDATDRDRVPGCDCGAGRTQRRRDRRVIRDLFDRVLSDARLLRPSGRPRRALWHAGGIAAFSSSGAALHGPSP